MTQKKSSSQISGPMSQDMLLLKFEYKLKDGLKWCIIRGLSTKKVNIINDTNTRKSTLTGTHTNTHTHTDTHEYTHKRTYIASNVILADNHIWNRRLILFSFILNSVYDIYQRAHSKNRNKKNMYCPVGM